MIAQLIGYRYRLANRLYLRRAVNRDAAKEQTTAPDDVTTSAVNHRHPLAGGCVDALKPPPLKRCDPPCSRIVHAYCQDTNDCGCERDFRSVQRSGHVVACVRVMRGTNVTNDSDGDNEALYFPRESREIHPRVFGVGGWVGGWVGI